MHCRKQHPMHSRHGAPLDSKVGDLAVQILPGLVPGLAARYHRLHWQSQGAPPELGYFQKTGGYNHWFHRKDV